MKKYLFFIACYTQITANSLEVTNLTSAQISVTIHTNKDTVTESMQPNLNPILNDVNEPAPNPTVINFSNNPITEIDIKRFSSNMVQTIYYDGQNTTNNQNIPGGINNINITGEGKMIVWTDYNEINGVAYSLTDLQSYITRCNALQAALSPTNLDATQKQLDNLTSTVQSVQASDMASQLGMQLVAIQTNLDSLTNSIKTIKTIQTNIQTLQDLQNNLGIGNNNLTGTNKPYQPVNDSIERGQVTLDGIKAGLQVITQTNPTGVVADQVQLLQAAINSTQDAINSMQSSKQASSIAASMMIPPTAALQTFQNT